MRGNEINTDTVVGNPLDLRLSGKSKLIDGKMEYLKSGHNSRTRIGPAAEY